MGVEMMAVNWQTIDKVVYINLNKRKDRRVRIARQLKAIGVPREKIVRFEAIEEAPGYIGCIKSHILVLQMAQQNGWKNVLILEDDMVFHDDIQTKQRIDLFLSSLQQINWHVALLAAHYDNVVPLKSVDYIVKPQYAWCACAYIVNSDYYATLIDNYAESLQGLLAGGVPQCWALDVRWNSLIKRDRWLGIFPNAGYQAADKSDIENQPVDYRDHFAKKLEEIVWPVYQPGEEKIKVDIFFQWAPGWTNFESVYRAMQAKPHFDCQIILAPYFSRGAKAPDYTAQRDLLNDKGIRYTEYHEYEITARKPHVVFLQNPYDDARPNELQSLTLNRRNISIAYIPYGLDMGDGERNRVYQYNLPCQNVARWVFVRSQRHKDEFAKYCGNGNHHVYVSGHPKLDNYPSRFGVQTDGKVNKGKPTLLWAPHFVMPDDEKMWSTFNLYTQAMLDIIKRDDVNLIIRPHPLFKQFLDIRKERGTHSETAHNWQMLREYSHLKSHVEWDFSADYRYAFSQSDALMADAGSFLLEYLPSRKPILFLTHENCLGINSSAEFIYDAYDVANESADIKTFVDNLVSGKDPMRDKRLQVLRDELHMPEQGAGSEIVKIIEKTLMPAGVHHNVF